MKLSCFALLLALVALPAAAADAPVARIPASEAAQHVGETATVFGVLNGYRYNGVKRPTYWNIDGRYPDNLFTAVIPANHVREFPNAKPLIGRVLAITGTIELYNGKPQIVLTDMAQVQVARQP
jgi:hypothetical protein